MKNILKTTTLALVCSMALTGCIKETFPTDSATSGQVSDSPTAVEAIVNAIPVNMTYPYSVYGRTNNYGFDFGYPGMMCATDAATGDVICSSGDEGSGYDWFTYWQSGILIGPTQTVCRFPWNCYYTFIKSSNDVVGLLAGNFPTRRKAIWASPKLIVPSSIWIWPGCTIRSTTSTPTFRASRG